MPGVHKSLNWTLRDKAAQRQLAWSLGPQTHFGEKHV